MSDLQSRLQTAVGDAYRIEKELGGGGMSFVFLAEEVELGRRVVIKVLPPDMAAGVNKERFQREIKLAASLQHPHIVPLLTAGTADGDLLYYVMPYIEGESLRAKLAREVELPVGEALKILREVVDALAYAHRHEVVHRDIKPDNVLLSEGHAVVTDFGVAKAVSASSGGTASGLTSLGMALGTPAYMSPEQAAADPHVDHRADIYGLGALAYEMLAGQPPFTGNTAQQLLAAHVSQTPEPVTQRRASVPPALADMIMRCLEKKAADRWQTADEMRAHLDAMVTPQSGGVTPTGTQPVAAVSAADVAAKHHPVRVAALFGATAAAVLAVAYGLMIALGLPDWVFLGAVILLAIGLPIMLVTSRHEKHRAVAMTTGLHVTTPAGLKRHFTWRNAIGGGGAAFAALTVVAGSYMGMRTLGIGPAATLASAGTIGEREPIVLAQLENRTPDSTLGSTVTELLRVSLSQSSFVKLVDPARLSESLGRMQRDPDTPVDEPIGLEIAEREGIKAVLSGDVVPLGDGFVISTRLLAADGTVLTAHQTSAKNPGEVMTAIDKVAAALRERMGESLRTIRRTAPLDLVTTGSLDALRLYTQASHAEIAGDDERAIDLLDQAIETDTTFAMAYRKLGIILGNNFEQRARAVDALTKAYEFRNRLTDIERGYAVAMYHSRVTGERGNVIAAYRTILDKYPDDFRALNNTGVTYGGLNDYERALDFYIRALAVDSTWSPGFQNIAFTQRNLGRLDDAAATIDAMERRFPGNPSVTDARGGLAVARGDFEAAEQHWQDLLERERASLRWRADLSAKLSFLAATRGRLAEARRHGRDALSATEQRGLDAGYLSSATFLALAELQLSQDPNRAAAVFEPAFQGTNWSELAVPDRPYEPLVRYFALTGNTRRARETVAEMEASGIAELGRGFERQYRRSLAWAELADGNYDRALAEMRMGNAERGCLGCRLADMARLFDATGQTDSAIVYWERFVETPWRVVFIDATGLPIGYRRLGELYEADGKRDKAVEYYNRFVELWNDADPELEPQVAEIRDRIARLVGEGK